MSWAWSGRCFCRVASTQPLALVGSWALVGAGAVWCASGVVIHAALLGVRRADLSLVGSAASSASRLVAVVAIVPLGVLAAGADASAAHILLWCGWAPS